MKARNIVTFLTLETFYLSCRHSITDVNQGVSNERGKGEFFERVICNTANHLFLIYQHHLSSRLMIILDELFMTICLSVIFIWIQPAKICKTMQNNAPSMSKCIIPMYGYIFFRFMSLFLDFLYHSSHLVHNMLLQSHLFK